MAKRITKKIAPELWQIRLSVPKETADSFAQAIESLVSSVAWFPFDVDADDRGEVSPWIVEAVSRIPPDRAALNKALTVAGLLLNVPTPKMEISRIPDTDWISATLSTFEPIDLGRFHVRGTHITDAQPVGRTTLLVDAGAAFGSGEHQTTKGCLTALDRLLRRRSFQNVLDMGCGSGILALAAGKSVKQPVLAADINSSAVQVTRANARLNKAAAWVTAVTSDGYRNRLIRARGPYDLILANILARPLIRFAAPLASQLAPGGVAILSGLLDWQQSAVLAAHRAQGLKLLGRVVIDGWATLVIAREPNWRL